MSPRAPPLRGSGSVWGHPALGPACRGSVWCPCRAKKVIALQQYKQVGKVTKPKKHYNSLVCLSVYHPVKDFLSTLTMTLPRTTLHHYNTLWDDKMGTHIGDVVPPGGLVCRIDYPERQPKIAKDAVSDQEYHKERFPLLVPTLSLRVPGGGAIIVPPSTLVRGPWRRAQPPSSLRCRRPSLGHGPRRACPPYCSCLTGLHKSLAM